MFSGIIGALGEVVSAVAGEDRALVVSHPSGWGNFSLGDSIAVNGCCLTVVQHEADRVTVEVMPETLRRTNLGRARPGDRVNLESGLALGTPVGGHLVSGHVDGPGRVIAVEPEANAVWLTLAMAPELGRYCVAQGSIAVDGCSLTLVSVADRPEATEIRASLIPHTLEWTIAGEYAPGAVVNLEVDAVAKLVERLLAPHLEGGLTLPEHAHPRPRGGV